MNEVVEYFDVDKLLDDITDKKLVVYNDDHNTFDWVILSFMEVLKHHLHQAEQCTMIIHTKGKCSVKEGGHDGLKPFRDALTERGLKAVIE
jgi:ATP-dependent Clp protease adaptor protein ClpS